jgi:hypothetical protein
MPGERPFGDGDDDSDLLRPSWQDTADETDADRPGAWPRRPAIARALPSSPDCGLSGAALAGLLVPLCDATDALARLDARAATAPEAVRDGLRTRMATAEAAGWLAHAGRHGRRARVLGCRRARSWAPRRLVGGARASTAGPPALWQQGRGGDGGKNLPLLLAGARAAQGWMEGDLSERPDPLHALAPATDTAACRR